jgi:hypothetical protein
MASSSFPGRSTLTAEPTGGDRVEVLCGEHLVQRAQVVDPAQVDLLVGGAGGQAVLRRLLQRRGDRVVGDAELAPGPVEGRRVQRGAAGGVQRGVHRGAGALGVLLGELDRRHVAAEQGGHGVRVLLQELGADDEVRGHELLAGPEVALVDQHVTTAAEHQLRGVRLRQPGAVELAALEQVEDVAVGRGRDRDVTAAVDAVLQPLAGQPGAQGDVLGVAQLRRGQRGALEIGGGGDPVPDDQLGATRRGSGDDADRVAVALAVSVDRRAGADVGGVQGAGEQRLHLVRTGVEHLRLQRGGAELLGEQPLVHPDEGRGVRDVGEVAEPELSRGTSAGGTRRGRVGRAAAAACGESEESGSEGEGERPGEACGTEVRHGARE